MNAGRAARAWPYAMVAAVAALPLAAGPLSGHPLYFRDLSLHFLPLRRFVLDGLRAGELFFWNPYIHEGEPLALPPIAYPFDLLQVLWPDEAGISLLLALHVPLAALWMMAFARRARGLSLAGAAAGGLVYALGGFALSTLNLYVYAQALAWAPAAMLGLWAAARGGRRETALAALSVAVLVSTTAAEMVAQAIAIGVLLALPAGRSGLARMAGALALGAGLAAPVAAVVAGVAADSARASGFTTDVVLAHSVHPLTLVQVIVAGWHADPARLADRFWGDNFFPRGFPYVLSLYIGLPAVAVAAVGALERRPLRRRLIAIAAVATVLALGRWGIGASLVEAFEVARRFRYPVKAFFSVHVAVALLAAVGADALARGGGAAWRRLAVSAGALGLVAVSAPSWPALAPGGLGWFAAGFLPARLGEGRMAVLEWILRDAATGGAIALVLGVVAVLTARERVTPRAAAVFLVALVAADLVRAGAGLNPAASDEFYTPSEEVARYHAAWRKAGRVFTCDPAASRAYAAGRAVRAEHERWTFALLRDTLVPSFNVTARIPSALSPDLTMLVPPERLLPPGDAGCAGVDRILEPLRSAGVAHVLSLDPLEHPDLALVAAVRPPALAPATLFVYAVAHPRPAVSVSGGGAAIVERRYPGRIDVVTTSAAGGLATVDEGYAAGWRATIDGAPAQVVRAGGRHLGAVVPAGAHVVSFRYVPPGLRLGSALAALALAITAVLLARPRERATT